jgi:hypothetical protein
MVQNVNWLSDEAISMLLHVVMLPSRSKVIALTSHSNEIVLIKNCRVIQANNTEISIQFT